MAGTKLEEEQVSRCENRVEDRERGYSVRSRWGRREGKEEFL